MKGSYARVFAPLDALFELQIREYEARHPTEPEEEKMTTPTKERLIDQFDLAGQLKRLAWSAREHSAGLRAMGDAEHEAIDAIITRLAKLIMGESSSRSAYIEIGVLAGVASDAAWVAARMEEEAEQTTRDMSSTEPTRGDLEFGQEEF